MELDKISRGHTFRIGIGLASLVTILLISGAGTKMETDTMAPVINNVTLNTSTPNTGDAILVTVDATDDIGVTSVTANDVYLAQSESVWTGTITALEGTRTVAVSASDAAGNIAWNNETAYTATTTDITEPVINSVILNTSTPITDSAILVAVDATDNVEVTAVEANGIPLINQGSNIWSESITALEGTHSVNVAASDAAGNVAWNNETTYTTNTPDNTPPVINSVALSTNIPNPGDSILVTVDATDDVAVTSVTANGVSLAQSGSVWTGTIIALQGIHTVTVTASDAANNIATDNSKSYTAISTVLPPRLSKTAPYANIPSQSKPNWGGLDREFIQAGHNDRIRQNGTIYQIRFAVADVSKLMLFNFTIWRQNGNNYDRLATTDNLIDYISEGDNTINLPYPIEGVQEGDFYGYRIKASVQDPLYVDKSDQNHRTYYTDEVISYTDYDWVAQTPNNYVFVIEPYMESPYMVFIGDSIISGHGPGLTPDEHFSFIETIDKTNIPATIENHWGRKVNKNYQNMGYGGQSTSQLNNRFNSDVVNLKPEFVLIEGGINDINSNVSASEILAYWKSMIQKAYSNNITPVIMLILPESRPTRASNEKSSRIDYINEQLIKMAAEYSPSIIVDARCYIGVDRLSGPPGNCWDINPSYTIDEGLHYNSAGNERIAQAIKDSFRFVHGKQGLYNLIQSDGTTIYSTNLSNAKNTSWRMASTSGTANVSYNAPSPGELANLTINSGTIDWFNIGDLSSNSVYYLRNSNGEIIESSVFVNGNVNFTSDMSPGTYYVAKPIVITIISPDSNSVNKTGYINVTVTLDKQGSALLNWDGTDESMSGEGTSFYKNKTGLLSGNYSFRVYAYDSNDAFSESETRIVTVDREIIDTMIGNFINVSTSAVNTTLGIEAPSGNVTLTIFNGTIATSNGTALNRIAIDSIKQVNPAYALTGNDEFIGENLTLGPAGVHFSPDIQLRFNYTAEQLAAAGISASELSVKYFNTSNNKWEALTIAERSSGDPGYIIVNVSHFSTFALIGTPSTPNKNKAGSGGSGGGGGGGGTSGESFENTLFREAHDMYIFNNQVTPYRFTGQKNPILFVNITGNANAGEIATVVEVLKDTSSLLNVEARGIVYNNINIWVGTSGFAVPKNIKKAVIMFRVKNSWIGDNNLKSSDIKMVVWKKNVWEELKTAEKANDSTYTYYEAETNSFSHFAITGLKKAEPDAAQIMTGTDPAITNTSANISAVNKVLREIIPQFEWSIILVVLILISIIVVLRSK